MLKVQLVGHSLGAGFFDQKIMTALEALDAGYLIAGKIYRELRKQADIAPAACW